MKSGITLGSWVAVTHDIAVRPGLDAKLMSGPWRVWETCLGRMNNWGHAAFDRGELAELVCGKDTESNRTMVGRWLKSLAKMGRIMPLAAKGSTQLCVVVNHDLAQRGAGRASDYLCSEPGHRGHQKDIWPPEAAAPEPAIKHIAGALNQCPACAARLAASDNASEVIADHMSALG